MTPTSPDRLDAYRRKRSASRTPEPLGDTAGGAPVTAEGGRLFVVQKHAARRLHWDLRLEWGGVLLSWAVPKGPSPDPAEKRLAVHVEDHPLDYADFEGVIPEGEYGAGPVIVWDRGVWIPVEDPDAGFERGKLLFELRGYKLRGRWTLVKTNQSEGSWLLIKERDGWVREEGSEPYPDASIYSGLTVDELEGADERAAVLARRVAEAGAEERPVDPRAVEIMLASPRRTPFSRAGWVFEIKYDGYRMVAGLEDGEAVLISRSGGDFTGTFPDVARAVARLPFDRLVLDGEVVIPDERGMPSFDRLQRRGLIRRRADADRAALELPATFYAFDLLGFCGFDLRSLPLLRRKEILREILPPAGPVRYSDHIEERGREMYEEAAALGLEGVVGKKADGPYRAGRSKEWLKVRAETTDEFVVVGWTEPGGSRTGFGALHLAQYDPDDTLVYRGSVGTGGKDRQLAELHARLVKLEREVPAFTGEVQNGRRGGRGHHWSRPELVCEVRYREITDQGLLRHPVFVRMRDDKRPEECRLGGGAGEALPGPASGEAGEATGPGEGKEVPLTNPDKVFWPEEGHTKGDLVAYYRTVSDWLLPYLRERPLVLTRYPDGIHGKSFFQKNAPEWAPDWIERVKLWSEDSQRDIEYFVCNDVESLLYVVNLGTIPLHVWSSRVSSLDRPDWCILDLDPKDAPFEHVVTIARHIRDLCDAIELPSFPKTSGSTGLHVLIPVGRQCGYDETRTLAELLARVVVAELPEIATVVRDPGKRGGRVYVDYVQNGRGRLLVAPFSARAVLEAAVSAPLRWSEVNGRLHPRGHTIESLPKRMRRLGEDPLAPVLELAPDLLSAVERLGERLESRAADPGRELGS